MVSHTEYVVIQRLTLTFQRTEGTSGKQKATSVFEANVLALPKDTGLRAQHGSQQHIPVDANGDEQRVCARGAGVCGRVGVRAAGLRGVAGGDDESAPQLVGHKQTVRVTLTSRRSVRLTGLPAESEPAAAQRSCSEARTRCC